MILISQKCTQLNYFYLYNAFMCDGKKLNNFFYLYLTKYKKNQINKNI